MKQNIEKYLKEQRFKLDVEEPEQDLIWEGIRSGLQEKQKRSLPEWFWKVAAIFIFVISATYFVVNETTEKQVVLVNLSDLSSDLGEQEKELKHLVNIKWNEVQQKLPKEDSELQFLLDELNELDDLYTTYQKDLNNTINNEPVIRAMLDNYEKKMKLLNRLLIEIEKQKNNEKTIIL
jgi:hypothetical protein